MPPNNSFKPNLLRYTKHMAEKACHVFGSATQVGLTQALGSTNMISHALLFPRSTYLAERWWHRFATVVFWAWLAVIAVFLYKGLILNPFSSCIRVKFAILGEPSDLDCGSNAFDYAWTNAFAESLPSIFLTGAFLVLAVYVAAILPSLAYRVVLYIAKGSRWRDPASAA